MCIVYVRLVRTPEYFPFSFHHSFKNIFKSVDSFWNFNTNLNFLYEKSQIQNFLSSFFFLLLYPNNIWTAWEYSERRITIQIWGACNPVKICKLTPPSSNSLSQSYSEKFPRQIFEGALPIAARQISGSPSHHFNQIFQGKYFKANIQRQIF